MVYVVYYRENPKRKWVWDGGMRLVRDSAVVDGNQRVAERRAQGDMAFAHCVVEHDLAYGMPTDPLPKDALVPDPFDEAQARRDIMAEVQAAIRTGVAERGW